jgi:hypothetical protein
VSLGISELDRHLKIEPRDRGWRATQNNHVLDNQHPYGSWGYAAGSQMARHCPTTPRSCGHSSMHSETAAARRSLRRRSALVPCCRRPALETARTSRAHNGRRIDGAPSHATAPALKPGNRGRSRTACARAPQRPTRALNVLEHGTSAAVQSDNLALRGDCTLPIRRYQGRPALRMVQRFAPLRGRTRASARALVTIVAPCNIRRMRKALNGGKLGSTGSHWQGRGTRQ